MHDYDDRAVCWMLYPSIIFLVIGLFLGVFIAFNGFVFPDYFSGEYVVFGKIRPMHVNHVAYLWLLSADIGLAYYVIMRLCGCNLWSIKLAKWTAIAWWSSLTIGIYSYPWGTNYGWEYAEIPLWVSFLPIKLIFTLSWVGVLINVFMTISQRKYQKMYVSLWYLMGSMVWTTFTYVVGNFLIDVLPGGLSRVNANFFYVHNLVGLTFTPLGVAAAYYFIPKISKTPLYSHKLSMLGFWTIAFVYAWVGAHHIVHGPMSQWLQTVAIIFSVWLIIPVGTVVANFFLTLKGHWLKYTDSVPIRFLMMGTLFYIMVGVQGPIQGLRSVNEITSKTDWVVGHAHMALYGIFSYYAMAGIYHVVLQVTKKPLYSQLMAEWHFNLNLIGALLFFISLFVGGFLQGLSWASWAEGSSYEHFHRNLTQNPFIQTIATMWSWWLVRALGGVLIFLGNLLFAFNIFNTVILDPVEEVSS